jgi:hypothetical protein
MRPHGDNGRKMVQDNATDSSKGAR